MISEFNGCRLYTGLSLDYRLRLSALTFVVAELLVAFEMSLIFAR